MNAKRFSLVLVFLGSVFSLNGYATRSKAIDLDKDGRTVIMAQVGALGAKYIIDPQACVCAFFADLTNSSAISVDCKKLTVYPELAPHVSACK
jgi:hypothetical protein